MPTITERSRAAMPTITERSRAALDASVKAAGYPINGFRGLPPSMTTDYGTCTDPQKVQVDSLVAAWDWSDAAQLTREAAATRSDAKSDYSATDAGGRVLRGVVKASLSAFNPVNVGQITWDPASLANNASALSPAITVTGARFHDAVDVGVPYDVSGFIVCGCVTANDTVAIRIVNVSGGTINLASGVWGVAVRRPTVWQMADAAGFVNNAVDADT